MPEREVPASRPNFDFLDLKHPVYLTNKDRWEVNEERLMGGDDVLPELRPFEWERKRGEGSHYESRKSEAVYVNFPEIFCSLITGHLQRFAPQPDKTLSFGRLGKVRRQRNLKNPTQAEQVYFNANTPGNEGMDWHAWWFETLKWAMATGHRWCYVESPTEEPGTQQEEIDGLRPYLTEYSPLDVPFWYYNGRGRLEFIIIRYHDLNPQLGLSGAVETEALDRQSYLLLVAEGCERLGPNFTSGGWFKFDPEKKLLDWELGWPQYDGEIPAFPLFYDRGKPTRTKQHFSRPGLTEIGQAAIAFMNLLSAGFYNAWNSSSGIEWLAGVDEEAMKLATAAIDRGDHFIPLPPHQETDEVPRVYQSATGAVPSDILDSREASLMNAVQNLGIIEALGDMPITGASKQATFGAHQVPRIVKVAQNLQAAQNEAIMRLEQAYGYDDPIGQVVFPTQFELSSLIDRIRSFFEIERLAGIRAETLDSEAMVQIAEEKGLVTDDDQRAKFLKEYQESAKRRSELEIAKNSEMQNPEMKDPNGSALQDKSREALKKNNKRKRRVGRPSPGE